MTNNSQFKKVLQAALSYAELGFSVIPVHSVKTDGSCTCPLGNKCKSPGKHPIGQWKEFQDTALKAEQIQEVFSKYPWANVGIVTGKISNLIVVDFDGNFEEYLKNFPQLLENSPATAQTSPGHFHMYVKYDPSLDLNNCAKLDDYIDIRTDGGFVVAPPSLHHSGKNYEWLLGHSLNEKGLISLDHGFSQYLVQEKNRGKTQRSKKDAYAQKALENEIRILNEINEGARNNALNKAAFSLAQFFPHKLLDPEVVRQELSNTAIKLGLSPEEIDATITSGFDAGSQKPRKIDENSKNSKNSSLHWREPEPFIDEKPLQETPFPIYLLPETAKYAAEEYLQYSNVPSALVGNAIISNMSLAAQGLANVARDSVLDGPCTVNTMTIAESGERKTSVDKVFSKGARRWETNKRKTYLKEMKAFRTDSDVHEQRTKKLQKTLNAAKSKAEQEKISVELIEHNSEAPLKPLEPTLFYEDVTVQALGQSIAVGFPVATLSSDEAGVFVGGYSMSSEQALQTLGVFNRFWDGSSFKVHRVTTESYSGENKRLSVNFAMQPDVFKTLCSIGDGKSRSTGNLARFLMSQPESKIGNRPYTAPCEMGAVKKFNDRIYEILDMLPHFENVEDAEIKPAILKFDKNAQKVWKNYYNECEAAQKENGELELFRDFASKSAEQAARIAAIFHVFEKEGIETHIDEHTMKRSVELARWYLNEAKRMLSSSTIPETHKNAQKLWDWLCKQSIEKGVSEISGNDILQFGPNPIRSKKDRDTALDILEEHGYIKNNKSGRSLIVEMNPFACK